MKTTIVALLLICITSFAFSDDTQIIINKPKGYGIERNLSESTKATVYMSEDNKTIISVTHEQYDLKGQNKKNLPDDLFLDIIAYKYVRTNFGKTLSGKDINSFSIDSSAKLYNAEIANMASVEYDQDGTHFWVYVVHIYNRNFGLIRLLVMSSNLELVSDTNQFLSLSQIVKFNK